MLTPLPVICPQTIKKQDSYDKLPVKSFTILSRGKPLLVHHENITFTYHVNMSNGMLHIPHILKHIALNDVLIDILPFNSYYVDIN
jgi:hypothetical protein